MYGINKKKKYMYQILASSFFSFILFARIFHMQYREILSYIIANGKKVNVNLHVLWTTKPNVA